MFKIETWLRFHLKFEKNIYKKQNKHIWTLANETKSEIEFTCLAMGNMPSFEFENQKIFVTSAWKNLKETESTFEAASKFDTFCELNVVLNFNIWSFKICLIILSLLVNHHDD